MFEKDYKSKGKIRRVHIHLSKHNSLNFKRCLFFRDYLINNKKVKAEYEKIKKQAFRLNKDGEGYRKYKSKFINKTQNLLNK